MTYEYDRVPLIVAFEDRLSEASTCLEIFGMSDQILQIRLEAHGYRPVSLFIFTETWCGANMVDARHPRIEISFVVLGAQWFEVETRPFILNGHFEVCGYERLLHRAKANAKPTTPVIHDLVTGPNGPARDDGAISQRFQQGS